MFKIQLTRRFLLEHRLQLSLSFKHGLKILLCKLSGLLSKFSHCAAIDKYSRQTNVIQNPIRIGPLYLEIKNIINQKPGEIWDENQRKC